MRILMVSDVYFPRINGVSTSIQTFRRDLIKLGHHVTLIAPDYGNQREERDILRIPARKVLLDPEDRMMQRGHIRTLKAHLQSEQFDVVHIQTPFIAHYTGVELARELDVPCVESYHTFFEEYLYHYVPFLPSAMMRYLARRFTRSQCRAVDALVVPSTPMLQVLRGYGVNTPAAIIPTGMELAHFDNGDGNAFKHQHDVDPARPTLVHIGRVAHEKNIDFLLDMLVVLKRHIPDVLLIIAGEGPALSHLKNRSRKLGLEQNVLFVGYLSREDALLDCYKAGDAFVFASRTETQGLVLLEAMALGVPVVSTAVMGTRDILSANKGALVAEEDTDHFAGQVERVLTDQVLHRRLSREAREYVQSWSADALAKKLEEFYQAVIAGRPLPENMQKADASAQLARKAKT
jgi:glycosyltransferase involved in cell wall biosynthesis